MSMDRKNKKAAQLAAGGSGIATGAPGGTSSGRESSGRGGTRAHRSSTHSSGGGSAGQPRSSLLTGSTAPTRSLSNATRPSIPMHLKATLSPSAPAPPVKDTDFASFGLPDESNQLSSAPAQGKSGSSQGSPTDGADISPHMSRDNLHQSEDIFDDDPTSSLPVHHSGSNPRRDLANDHASSSVVVDFGPIGSPPHVSLSANRVTRMNGFSPGTSPQPRGLSTSPFSAPGSQSVFVVNQEESNDFRARSGLSASLGNVMTWVYDHDPAPARRAGVRGHVISSETVVEDEDLEEFLPSSLTDLLSPEERSRRFSRTNGVRPVMQGGVDGGEMKGVESRQGTEAHHRHSRSVPAPSLMRDIRSIWGDQPPIGSPDAAGTPSAGGLGNGTPSSFQSNGGFTARSPGDIALSPSNASAAFLPGLHQHFLNKTPTAMKSSGTTLYPGNPVPNRDLSSTSYSAVGIEPNGLSNRLNAFGTRPPFDPTFSDSHFVEAAHRQTSSRPIPDGFVGDGDDRRQGMSPSARALQAHAPGQSLPQGLAAGYSRIHALPPPPVIPSPTGSGMFSVGQAIFSPNSKISGQGSTAGEWNSVSPNGGSLLDHTSLSSGLLSHNTAGAGSLGGLESVFSRLSYSAAASRELLVLSQGMRWCAQVTCNMTCLGPTVAATGLGSRIPSGRGANIHGSLSPLSGPVVTGDEDVLFTMDG